MDLSGVSSTRAAEPAAHRRRIGGTEEESAKLVKLVAKLTLSNALQCRVLRAVSLSCYKISSKSQFVTVALTATKGYSEKSKDVPKAERVTMLHHPHTHVFNAWLSMMKTKLKDGEPQKMLALYLQLMESMGGAVKALQEMGKGCKYARITKMYDQEHKRLEVNFRDISDEAKLWEACVLPAVLAEGATQLEGVAPQGDLERRIQESLQELGPSTAAGQQ